MYQIDYDKYESTDLCMSVSDNFSKVKASMAKFSNLRLQIMRGFFIIDGEYLLPSDETLEFHNMDLKPDSKIILVRLMSASE